MRRLIVRYEKDIASVNMVDRFIQGGEWSEAGTDREGRRYITDGDDTVVYLQHQHIRSEHLDRDAKEAGFVFDVVVFPSVHSAQSGIPALTVHPIGNYHEAEHGGEEGKLVPACPAVMTDMLRAIKAECNIPEYNICFEVTHHGPYLETPTMFLEIGSDESCWGRSDAADIQSRVLAKVREKNDYVNVIGIGGGHYAPRFTELALSCKVNFGHMLPNYQMEGRSDEDVAASIRKATEASRTECVFIHRKSMKGSQATHLRELAESLGCEVMRSEDFEPLTGN